MLAATISLRLPTRAELPIWITDKVRIAPRRVPADTHLLGFDLWMEERS